MYRVLIMTHLTNVIAGKVPCGTRSSMWIGTSSTSASHSGFFVCLKGVGTQGRHPSWTSAKQTVFGAALTKPQPDSFTTDVHRLAGNGLPDDPASTMQKVPMFAQNAVNAHVG